jgi:hypothetical protein
LASHVQVGADPDPAFHFDVDPDQQNWFEQEGWFIKKSQFEVFLIFLLADERIRIRTNNNLGSGRLKNLDPNPKFNAWYLSPASPHEESSQSADIPPHP